MSEANSSGGVGGSAPKLSTPIKERLWRARDWTSAIDELEREADNLSDNAERSAALYELGGYAEEVVPERDRALAIYQRAWQLQRDNVKALSRAREVYHELGRLEMVAKVGQIELKLKGGSDVELHLEYEVHLSPLGFILRSLFDEIANSQLNAFVRRAGVVYGEA